METLKVKVKKVVQPELVEEQEKEIELPFFSKSKEGLIRYMIREDKSVITVVHYESWGEWNVYWNNDKSAEMKKAVEGQIISREEFMEQYKEAFSKIQEPIPTREEVESTETIY